MNSLNSLSKEDKEYVLNLPYHLAEAGMGDNFYEILTDFEFLDNKVLCSTVQLLIEDYNFSGDFHNQISIKNKEVLDLIRDNIQLSAHTLSSDKTQLSTQLWGRMGDIERQEIKHLLKQARPINQPLWLKPINASLISEREGFIRTLSGHSEPITSVSVTSDGKFIVSGSEDATLKIWDFRRGIEIQCLIDHSTMVSDIAISSDCKTIVSGSGGIPGAGDCIKIWDFKTGREQKKLLGHTGYIEAIEITQDGKYIISASADLLGTYNQVDSREYQLRILLGKDSVIDNTIRIWDFNTGEQRKILSEFSIPVTAIKVTPDNKRVIVGLFDGTIKIVDFYNGLELLTLNGHTEMIKDIKIVDEQYIISASFDQTIKFWDIITGELIKSLEANADAIAITYDHKFMVSASENKIIIWDLKRGIEVFNYFSFQIGISSIAISPDDKFIISGAGDGTIKISKFPTDFQRKKAQLAHNSYINSVAIASDSRTVISASQDKTLKLWELNTGKEKKTLIGHTGSVNSIAIAPDNRLIVSGSEDQTLKIWNLDSCHELNSFSGHSASITSVAISPDGKFVISASADKTLKVWDLYTGKQLLSFTKHQTIVIAVAITPDGKNAISIDEDNILKVWDYSSGMEIATWKDKVSGYQKLSITSDGKRIIIPQEDNSLKVWTFPKFNHLETFAGHSAWPVDVDVTVNSQFAISSAEDGTLKLWNLKNGTNIASFTADTPLRCCAVSAEGNIIVTGDYSGKLHFLRVIH